MTQRTVTTQTKLDAALADQGISSIIIDSPRGIWLTRREGLKVTTQEALDKALADGVTDLIVEAPAWAYLEIRHDGLVRLFGSSRVVARGSSSVVARGSSRVVARESSSVVAWGSSRVVARESSRVEAWGSSSVEAWGSSSVVARGSSRVVARESSSVVAWGSSRVVARESSRVEAWGSSSVEAWGSSSVVARESSSVVAGRFTAVHLRSQRVTLTGEGRIIDMTAVDLTEVETWHAYIGADSLVRPDRDQLVVGHVSSQDHEGRLGKDGQIVIGCFEGDVAKLRKLIEGEHWPSHADADRRAKYRPRILAFADLCEQQLAAWAEAAK